MKTSHAKFSRRTMAQAMATIWLAMAVSQPVLGAPTDISDVPMAVLDSGQAEHHVHSRQLGQYGMALDYRDRRAG